MSEIRLNNIPLNRVGVINFSHGSGDNQETWSFETYKLDDGALVLKGEDKGKHHLYYRLAKSPDLDIVKTHETCEADTISGLKGFGTNDTTCSWCEVSQCFEDVPKPFERSNQVMILSAQSQKAVFVAVALAQERNNNFYSARFPASEMQTKELEEAQPTGALGRTFELAMALFLLIVLGYSALTGASWPVKAFWWSPLVFGPIYLAMPHNHRFAPGLRFGLAAFFLHFATHFLDTIFTGDYWNEPASFGFEGIHAIVIVVLLMAVRIVWYRGYCVLVDSSYQGGGCAWLVLIAALGIVSLNAEFNYFNFFRWYAGNSPWGFLWLVPVVGLLLSNYEDYAKTPLGAREFRRQLHQLHRIFTSGLAGARGQSDEVVRICDDLEDGVRLSKDPQVQALYQLGPCFLRMRDAAKNLSDITGESKEEAALLEADFATVASDLEDILSQFKEWGRGAELKMLRVSPFLQTYND